MLFFVIYCCLLILLQLAGQKLPVVIHKTPFDKWKSINWTLQHLLSRSREIGHILSKKGTSNVFRYFANEQPLGKIDLTRAEKDYIEVVYSAQTFLEMLLNDTHDGFYYYASGDLGMLNLGDVATVDSHRSMTFPSHLQAFAELGQVNFWLGKSSVSAHTHYDTSYNLHHVVQGRKRFILFPPEAHSKLKLYPCLHQLYRQVSEDVAMMDREGRLNEFLREVGGFEVVLVDGDVLFIPPYWFHSVVTMETSISLNIWSQSEVFLIMEDIYKSPIPFEAEWGKIKLMKTLHYFIQIVVQGIIEESETLIMGIANFMMEYVYRRYEIILQQKDSQDVEQMLDNLRPSVREYCLKVDISQLLESGELKHIKDGAFQIVNLFSTIDSDPIRLINLGNYIEHLVWRILGSEDLIKLPIYVLECFKA